MKKVILPLASAILAVSVGFNAAQYDSNQKLSAELDKKGNEIIEEKKKSESLLQKVTKLDKEHEELKSSYKNVFEQKSELEQKLEERKQDISKLKLELEKKKTAEKKAAIEARELQRRVVNNATPPSRGTQPQSKKTVYVTATAYTAYCTGCSGITKTGINLRKNPNAKVIAVDPNVIPLGTRVHVEGYGYAVAGDIGGAIKGNKIDLHMPTKNAAYAYGRKHNVKVNILD